MKQYIVAFSIDKVQTFLYHVLCVNIQENQSNSGTLKDIMNSSKLISEQFFQDIGLEGDTGVFSSHVSKELLKCSGICIFMTSLHPNEIIDRADCLFQDYYKSFAGQLLVKYVYFEKEIVNGQHKLEAIKESKERLRQTSCLNAMIERQHELLFQFNKVPPSYRKSKSTIDDSKYPAFSRTINELFSNEEKGNENHFRIAVIKADLDGMGDWFGQIKTYEGYKAVSDLLSSDISLESLHRQAQSYQNKNKGKQRDKSKDTQNDKRNHFTLYPLYIAGDDIFFAVASPWLTEGVNICKNLLEQLNEGIKAINITYGTNLQPLSMSIGIDFTFNREPIRYYYERVQQQVECAKQVPPLQELSASYVKVSINQYVFYDFDPPKDKKEVYADIPNWRHFLNMVKRLKQAISQGYVGHHFFYHLLEKITDPTICKTDVKYSNAVLYHLLPANLGSSNIELAKSELLILESLIKQLLVKRGTYQKAPHFLNVKPEQRKRLESYVRLLLLFSDPRFNISEDQQSNSRVEYNGNDIRKTFFNKALRYLYEQSLLYSLKKTGSASSQDNRKTFRDILVKHTEYSAKETTREAENVKIYRTLRISSSMFHRLKNRQQIDIYKAAEMIHYFNDRTEETINELEEQRASEKKAPPNLFFDKDSFIRTAKRSQLWTQDYIDSLYILYQYNELSIQFKSNPKLSPGQEAKNTKPPHKNAQRSFNKGQQSYRGKKR
ncbi:Cas10/Cmr2 second palm domain-containing protein [Paenibacillus assamensis]|uniref:Cas10/Cmr2 second palm domain-containing protein n=1 Tax=Paenibacillus assamensis TaxID=311244 RepID=UPI0003F996B3|nr:hypothetical protein [Paenibacillus assamensis]